jgi:hypothetical protein
MLSCAYCVVWILLWEKELYEYELGLGQGSETRSIVVAVAVAKK